MANRKKDKEPEASFVGPRARVGDAERSEHLDDLIFDEADADALASFTVHCRLQDMPAILASVRSTIAAYHDTDIVSGD